MIKLWVFTSVLASSMVAQSFFVLTGLKSYDPVVSIGTSKVDKKYRVEILELMESMSKELGVSTKGHSSRALAFDIRNFSVGDTVALKVDLIMGETVLRAEDKEQIYVLSYMDTHMFVPEDLEEDLMDNVEEMLEKFALQYKEDNKKTAKSTVELTHESFATEMGYETDYNAALSKAKKADKPLMILMTTNFCPWCRKFEKRVLAQALTDKKIKEKFIPLMLNFDEKKFPTQFNDIAMTPTVYIVNAKDEKIQTTFIGYSSRDEFLHLLK